VDVKLKSTTAVWPPRGDPTVNQFLRPMAIRFISRSATLLSAARTAQPLPMTNDS
jgi:hypothetical protein